MKGNNMAQQEARTRARDKVKEILALVKGETASQNEREQQKSMFIFCICVFIITFFTSIMNITIGSWFMAGTTCFMWISSLIFAVLLSRRKHIIHFVIGFYVYTISAIFTYYFIVGGNEGFAALWIILVPFFIVLVGSSRQLVYISTYFQLLLVLFCYTPLNRFLMFSYSHEFLKRFPVLYLFCFIVSVAVAYRIRTYEIAQEHAVENLNQAVFEEKMRNRKLSFQTIIAMSVALDAKDESTKHHSERVAEISRAIALELGWPQEKADELYQAGMVHDIGKIGISDSILKKAARLTDDEYQTIKTHPEIGYQIVRPCIESETILNVVRYHHERYDGKGYPEGLRGEEIPLEARIASVADTFDAMNSNRVYRRRCDRSYVVQELQRGRGTQFDPQVVDTFMTIIDQTLAQYDVQENAG